MNRLETEREVHKRRPVVGIMTGYFREDDMQQLLVTIEEALGNDEIDIRFYFGPASSSFVEKYALDDVGFGCHYYSLYSYSNYDAPDLLVVIYGSIKTGQKHALDLHKFMAHLPRVPVILLKENEELPENPGSVSINADNYAGIASCVQHMISCHGKRRIGFLSGSKNHADAQVRLKAYRETLEKNGIPYDERLVSFGDFMAGNDDAAQRLLDADPLLDTVVCANDELAASVLRVAEKRGKRPGRDFFVTGFDDIPVAAYMNPPLTTVRQDYGDIARACARKIRTMLHGAGEQDELIPVKFIPRMSCGCSTLSRGSEGDKDEAESSSLLLETRRKAKRVRSMSLLSALILRNLQMKDITEKKFFLRLARILHSIGTKSAIICLLSKAQRMEEGEMLQAPSRIRLYMLQQGESCEAYDRYDAPEISYGGMTRLCSADSGAVNRMNFVLFHGGIQYGILSVEIDLGDVPFYDMLSLEVGSALFSMYIALEQQELQRVLEEKNQILDYAASHDELTGILNRTGIMSRVVDFIHETGSTRDVNYAVVMADLDHLKQINDTFGHKEGDYAIRKAAQVLKQALPEGSPLGRSGGDEFTAVFIIDDPGDMEAFAGRVRILCEECNAESDKPYYINVSTGCFSVKAGESAVGLKRALEKADERLYEAKKFRRMNVVREPGSTAPLP